MAERTMLVAALVFVTVARLAIATADAAPPPALPETAQALAPGMRMQGTATMSFLGIDVYDAWYWAPTRAFSVARPFALDLRYHLDLDGAQIAERSIAEIARLGEGTPDQRARWLAAMKATFPSVAKGDRLVGVNLPGEGVRFLHNGKPIGAIADPAFAQAFFGIWLDPRTSQPELRSSLLGISPGPP